MSAAESGRPRWDPDVYARNARFVSDLGVEVLEWLAPRPGERVLDLGCGDGALTARLVDAGCDVVGVDASPEQVAAARARGLDACVCDGARLPFRGEFDAVFSNAALHWMRPLDAVVAGVHRALRPGGRFVGEMGGRGCVETLRRALRTAVARRGLDPDAVDPWTFPDDEEYARTLEAAGFRVGRIALFPRPTPLPGDVTGWLETFARTFTEALPPEARPAFVAEVRDEVRSALRDESGRWTADYVRLRFAAHRADR